MKSLTKGHLPFFNVEHVEDMVIEFWTLDRPVSSLLEAKRAGLLHRENGPAVSMYSEFGVPLKLIWLRNGLPHRDHGPAYVLYSAGGGGGLRAETWYRDGQEDRQRGPSRIEYDFEGRIASTQTLTALPLPVVRCTRSIARRLGRERWKAGAQLLPHSRDGYQEELLTQASR